MKLVSLLFLLIFSSYLIASPVTYDDVIVSEVRSIYDGDTFKVNINSWPDVVGESVSVRVLGIDTPELRGKCRLEKELARDAKKFTAGKLRAAKFVELKNIQRGKYFRLLADVYADGENLGDQLIKVGHARVYDGGAREGWCK